MIKPATLWGLFKSCSDSEWLGAICRALGGQDVELDFGQSQMVNSIKMDSGWMDERIEAQRERWRDRQRGHRGKRFKPVDNFSSDDHPVDNSPVDNSLDDGDNGDNGDMSRMSRRDNGDNGDMSHVTQCHVTSIRPSVHPSIQSKISDTDIGKMEIDAETIRRYRTMANAFAQTLRENIHQAGAIFMDTTFDTVAIACGITGEFSVPLWKSYVRDCGDAAVREEIYQMWDEIRNGEEPKNRAAALNKRLKAVKELNQQGTTK